MELVNSEEEAKRLIMSEPSFQTDGRFDQNIFEATIRANGILPNEYIENVQNTALVNDFLSAVSDSSFTLIKNFGTLKQISFKFKMNFKF